MAADDNRRLFRILRGVLATAFLFLASATYYLWYQYAYTRPSVVNQESSKVYPLYAQGWTVYLTRGDQFRLYGLAVAAAACLAGAVALDAFVLAKKERD